MRRLGDDERRPRAHDALRFAEDDLEPARVLAARQLSRAIRRLHVVETYDAPLDLRDGLLRDDDDVAVLEVDSFGDQRAEVVPLSQLGNACDGDDLDHGRPVTEIPAWPL